MKADVRDGWVRFHAGIASLGTPTVSFENGPWLPCFVDQGDAVIRPSATTPGRRSWRLRVGGVEVGSGVVEIP